MLFRTLLRKPLLIYIGTIIWFALLFYGTLKPSSSLPKISIPHLDKLIHFLMFLGAAFLVMLWRTVKKKSQKEFKQSAHSAIVVSFITGLGIELLQSTAFIQRGFEWADLLFDMLGAMAGVYLFAKVVIPYIISPKIEP